MQTGSRARSERLNNLDCSLTMREEEEGLALIKEIPQAHSYSSQVLRPGERFTASQIKSFPVSSLMTLQTAGDSRRVSAEPEHERKILSTSPPSPSLRDMTPIESPVAKLPIPVVPIDRKGKREASEMLNSSKLHKNSQSNVVSTVSPTVGPNVSTTPEPSHVKDEKSNAMLIQTKMDTLSKYSFQNAVNIENRLASTYAPSNVFCEVNVRPSSLRRTVPSTDEKQESKTLQPVSTVSAVSQEDHFQTESIKRQRTVSGSFHFNVSSDKNQERPRTASFTGVVGQAGLKKEATEPTKPSLDFKIERQVSSQVEKTIKNPFANLPPVSKKEDKIDFDPVIPMEENQDNKIHEIGVEATEDVMEDMTAGIERETTNAFGVKLRSTSLSLKFRLDKAQSEDKAKGHSVEVSLLTPPQASQTDSTCNIKAEDQHTSPGSIRLHTKLKDPSLQTNESSTSVQSSSSPPKGFCRDKERAGFLRHTGEFLFFFLVSHGA